MITTLNLTFAYPGKLQILKNINLTIPSGSHVALLGKNGSGKTTLALLLKGLLKPSDGVVTVDGLNSGEEEARFEIMKRVGLIFQNPDSTIISTTVERELAFGLENMGMPTQEMKEQVDETLKRFDLEPFRHTNPIHLSGGEKQRLALAAVMIMHPSYLILDEPTSLLDPSSSERMLRLIHTTACEGATVIHITQFAAEMLLADRALVLDESGICFDGPPDDVLEKKRTVRSGGFVHSLSGGTIGMMKNDLAEHDRVNPQASRRPVCSISVALENISHWYDKGTPFAHKALSDITLELHEGTATVVLGPAGAGKTTLLEIASGVTIPSQGEVHRNSNQLRAMAFQFPEDQMSGDTVESYISFGPENIGIPESQLHDFVESALEDVGLDPYMYCDRDPITLSGGEARRVALAGVLAMKPDVLILDEPTAGLDWEGMKLVLGILRNFVNGGGTLLFSTHDLEVAQCLAVYAVVLEKGNMEMYGRVFEVFGKSKWIASVKDRIKTLVETSKHHQ